VILVRHGHAGNKAAWHDDDDLRPLSTRGLAQAAGLVVTLTDEPVSAAWTSAALRCRQTLEPLAAERDLPVHDHPLLGKAAPAHELLEWLLAHEAEHWVVCTHGEVFKSLAVEVRAAGLINDIPEVSTAKGAAWRVAWHQDGSTALDYLPPLLIRRPNDPDAESPRSGRS